MNKSYYCYIATNYTNTVLYTGMTNSLENRMFQHQHGVDNSSFTSRYKVNKLVWFQEFNTPLEAIAAEKKIKGWTRVKKINLITEQNPFFKDLTNATLDSSPYRAQNDQERNMMI